MPWQDDWLHGADTFWGLPVTLAALGAVAHMLSYAAFRNEPARTPFLWLAAWVRPIAIALVAIAIIVFAGETRRFIYFDF